MYVGSAVYFSQNVVVEIRVEKRRKHANYIHKYCCLIFVDNVFLSTISATTLKIFTNVGLFFYSFVFPHLVFSSSDRGTSHRL